MSDASLSDQIRAAQFKAANPVESANFRDALTLRVVESTIRDLLTAPNERYPIYAGAVLRVVDCLMVERQKRVEATLAEIETWGKERAKLAGMALISGGDSLACALIRRFGGEVEIPMPELDDTVNTTRGFTAEQDAERGTIRFALLPREKED